MKKRLLYPLACLAILASCTPKTGEKSSRPETSAQAAAKAPVIPIPEGDIRKNAPKPGDAPQIRIGKAETFQLANGLTVIVVENHKLPKVSYRVFVDYDPVLEKEAAGYVDMVGALLTKGTQARTKAQIDEAVDFLGASLNADANGVSGSCLSKHSDKLLPIMSEVLLKPAFPEAEFEKIRRQEESRLMAAKEDPAAMAANVNAVLKYGKEHPYGEITTPATLSKITLDKIKTHYQTFFKPNISYLVITGDITREKAEKQAKKYFGAWQKGEVPKQPQFMPRAPEQTRVAFVHKPGAVQTIVNITYPVDLKPGSTDALKVRVMNAVLGGYFKSRINTNLRETHGWTYGAGSSLVPDKWVGSFNASASVRNVVTDSAVVEILKEMNRLRSEKIPRDELRTVKNVLTGQFSQSLEEPGTVAQFALNIARYGLPADYYEQYLSNLQAISAEEVLFMAKRYLTPDNAHIIAVGNKDEVAEKLQSCSPGGPVQFYDAYGNPVKPAGNTAVPPGMDAGKVIEDYLNAIGGNAAVNAIRDLKTTSTMQTPGPTLSIKTSQKGGDKIAVEVSIDNQPVNKQVFDGAKGFITGGGPEPKAQPLEGEALADLKEQALFCKEAAYAKNGYKLNLKGIERVGAADAYAIEVTRPDGKKSTDYYDVKTSLKLREESTAVGPGGPLPRVVDFSNYRPVGGVQMPWHMSISGMLPVPVSVQVTDIRVNEGVEDEVFK